MIVGTYAPRVPVHPTRHGPRRTVPILWAVLHTSEGWETGDSAEQLGEFMGRPATATNVASYHDVADTDRIIPAVPHDVVAYAAGGGNAQGVHLCFPGRAGQTRAQWLDLNSRSMIRQGATWLVDVHQAHDIPLERIDPADLLAGRSGVCDHHDVSLAFHKSNHTDVGDAFPWDVLWSDVAEILEEDTDMPEPHRYILDPPANRKGGPSLFVEGGGIRYANNLDTSKGFVRWTCDSTEQYDNYLRSLGLA